MTCAELASSLQPLPAALPVAALPVAPPAPPRPPHPAATVLGTPVDDAGLAAQLRRVAAVTAAMAVLAVVSGTVQLTQAHDASGAVLAALGIPLCGLAALRFKSRSCLRAFKIFNGLCGGLFLLTAAVTLTATLPRLECYCSVGCTPPGGVPGPVRLNTTAAQAFCAEKGGVVRSYYFALGLGAATAFLQLLGSAWAAQLESNPFFSV